MFSTNDIKFGVEPLTTPEALSEFDPLVDDIGCDDDPVEVGMDIDMEESIPPKSNWGESPKLIVLKFIPMLVEFILKPPSFCGKYGLLLLFEGVEPELLFENEGALSV